MNGILAAVPLLKENPRGMYHFQVLIYEIIFVCYLVGAIVSDR